MREWKFLTFLLYVFLGAYFVNFAIGFYELPDFFSQIQNWLFLIGGVLIFIGGISILMGRKKVGGIPGFPQ